MIVSPLALSMSQSACSFSLSVSPNRPPLASRSSYRYDLVQFITWYTALHRVRRLIWPA